MVISWVINRPALPVNKSHLKINIALNPMQKRIAPDIPPIVRYNIHPKEIAIPARIDKIIITSL